MYNRPSTPSYKVGSGIRQPLNENEHTPGPGSYSIPSTNTGPRVRNHFLIKIIDIIL